ncbi:hypothetical protein [Pseudonocardia pini]|uniref:hypothetical protein n=1 Tax=Pseudonocardia pini TaxID=2758030 RepID=UPI0015EFE439|nr:hypothetical protein [Pseudonocardia pini]
MSRPARPIPSTGHPKSDALVPAALAFVYAVHDGKPGQALDAYAEAERLSDGDPYWVWTWCLTLAALVPVDARLSELLAWTEPAPAPQGRAPRAPRKAA